MSEKGFTLVELLVVLVILAAVLAAIPSILPASRSKAELRSAVREIANELRQTRSQAIATSQSKVFTLNVQRRAFSAGGGATQKSLPASLEMSLYTVTSELVDRSRGSIRFFPDGSSTGGRITVANGSRDARSYVDVDWLTGRISVRE